MNECLRVLAADRFTAPQEYVDQPVESGRSLRYVWYHSKSSTGVFAPEFSKFSETRKLGQAFLWNFLLWARTTFRGSEFPRSDVFWSRDRRICRSSETRKVVRALSTISAVLYTASFLHIHYLYFTTRYSFRVSEDGKSTFRRSYTIIVWGRDAIKFCMTPITWVQQRSLGFPYM